MPLPISARLDLLVALAEQVGSRRVDAGQGNAQFLRHLEVAQIAPVLDHAPYPPSVIPDPFGPADDDPFRAQVTLPAWTIDDAAWLVEALSIACRSSGVTQDIELAVRLVDA